MSHVVRIAAAADLDAVLRVQAACHAPALLERAECISSILAHGASFVAFAVDTAEVVGYALLHPGASAALGETVPPPAALAPPHLSFFLHDVAVRPSARGAGVARQLVLAALAHARATHAAQVMHLVALPGTGALWSRFGFEPHHDDAFDDAASYGDGAVHMRALLTDKDAVNG